MEPGAVRAAVLVPFTSWEGEIRGSIREKEEAMKRPAGLGVGKLGPGAKSGPCLS